jgi:hypothetical protein
MLPFGWDAVTLMKASGLDAVTSSEKEEIWYSVAILSVPLGIFAKQSSVVSLTTLVNFCSPTSATRLGKGSLLVPPRSVRWWIRRSSDPSGEIPKKSRLVPVLHETNWPYSNSGLSVTRPSPVSRTFFLHSHTSIWMIMTIPLCELTVPIVVSPVQWNRNLSSLLHTESISVCSRLFRFRLCWTL